MADSSYFSLISLSPYIEDIMQIFNSLSDFEKSVTLLMVYLEQKGWAIDENELKDLNYLSNSYLEE